MSEKRQLTGDDIRRLREERHMTQAELAEVLGVGPRTIRAWETDENVPRNRMGAMLRFFEVEGAAADDPLRSVGDVELLAELMRRAITRERRRNDETN